MHNFREHFKPQLLFNQKTTQDTECFEAMKPQADRMLYQKCLLRACKKEAHKNIRLGHISLYLSLFFRLRFELHF